MGGATIWKSWRRRGVMKLVLEAVPAEVVVVVQGAEIELSR